MHFLFHSPYLWILIAVTVYWVRVFVLALGSIQPRQSWELLGWLVAAMVAVSRIGMPLAEAYRSLHGSDLGELLLTGSRLFQDYVQRGITTLAVDVIAMLVVVSVFSLVAWRTRETVLSYQDARLIGIGALMVGWPQVCIFLFCAFLLAFFALAFQKVRKRSPAGERIRIAPYVAVAAIATIWFGSRIADWTGLSVIRF